MVKGLSAAAVLIGVYVGACAVLVEIREALGLEVVGAISVLALFGAAWLGHSPRSAELRDLLEGAWRDEALTHKVAAIDMGLPPSQLSEQLAGHEHLSLWRLAALPDAVLVAFALRLLARYGPQYTVVSQPIADLVQAVQALSARGKKRMARMEVA